MEFSLDRKLNHKYYDLLDSIARLEDMFLKVNHDLNQYSINKIPFWRLKNEKVEINLDRFHKECEEFQAKVCIFLEKANNFLKEPKFNMDNIEDGLQSTAFLYFISQLQFAIYTYQRNLDIIVHNITQLHLDYDNIKNFKIAISSWVVTTISLFATIIGLIIAG